MKLSVSLPDDDVEYLDEYARVQRLESRSAALHKAVRLLRASELGGAYEDVEPQTLVLVFDRAVDASAFDGSVVFVNDDVSSGILWSGNGGFEQPTAETLRIALLPVAVADPGPVTLTTAGPTGIVAVDDGEPWAGVNALPLPFP